MQLCYSISDPTSFLPNESVKVGILACAKGSKVPELAEQNSSIHSVCLLLGCPINIKRLMMQNPHRLKHPEHGAQPKCMRFPERPVCTLARGWWRLNIHSVLGASETHASSRACYEVLSCAVLHGVNLESQRRFKPKNNLHGRYESEPY